VLIDRSHKGWITFTIVATVLAGGYYAFYQHQSYQGGGNGPSGGSWTGLAYGIVGFALMIFCGLLGVRRKVRVWRLGRAESWLRAHIWLGLLAFPLILFHAGIVMGNRLTLWLMVIFIVVTVTGIIGVMLQNVIPRTMLMRVQAETTFEQIPSVIKTLRTEADDLVSKVCGPLSNEPPPAEGAGLPAGAMHGTVKKDGAVQGKVVKKGKSTGPLEGSGPLKTFYLGEVQPFLNTEAATASKLAEARSATALFEHTRTLLPEPLHETLKDLEYVCEERRQLALQARLHFWLHAWEFMHVPLSYALLVMSVVHAIIATFKY
jgi:hypothetical protein